MCGGRGWEGEGVLSVWMEGMGGRGSVECVEGGDGREREC